MKCFAIVSVVAALIFSAIGHTSAQVLAPKSEQDGIKAHEIIHEYARAVSEGNAEKASALVEPDSKLKSGKLTLASLTLARQESFALMNVHISHSKGLVVAISESLKLSEPKLVGHDSACLVFLLTRTGESWQVRDIDLQTEEVAKQAIAAFLQQHADAADITDIAAKGYKLDPPPTRRTNPPNAADQPDFDDAIGDADLTVFRTGRVSVEVRIARDTPYKKAVEVWHKLEGLNLDSINLAVDDRQSGGVQAVIRATPDTHHKSIVIIIRRLREAGVDQLSLGKPFDKVQADATELKKQKRREVEAAFEARQQLQRAELVRLQQRLTHIEDLIESRERIKDQIIERRVEELLDPNLRWQTPDESASLPQKTQQGTNQTNGEPTNAATDRVPALDPFAAPNPLQESMPGSRPQPRIDDSDVGRATELRKKIDALVAEVASGEAILKHHPQHDDFGGISKRLENARRNLQIHRDELAAYVRLFELELRHAESAVQSATTVVERNKKLATLGVISQETMLEHQQALGAARLRSERARTLLELCLKADSHRGAGPPEARDLEPAASFGVSSPAIVNVLQQRLALVQKQYEFGRATLPELLTATKEVKEAEVAAAGSPEVRLDDLPKKVRANFRTDGGNSRVGVSRKDELLQQRASSAVRCTWVESQSVKKVVGLNRS